MPFSSIIIIIVIIIIIIITIVVSSKYGSFTLEIKLWEYWTLPKFTAFRELFC